MMMICCCYHPNAFADLFHCLSLSLLWFFHAIVNFVECMMNIFCYLRIFWYTGSTVSCFK